MISNELMDSYQAATDNGGFFSLPKRCWLELTGNDRAAFLHNFCTADINGLQPGTSAELFILDGRGKTLAFGHVFAIDQRLLITTAYPEHSSLLFQHLDKYVIREDVAIVNQTDFWSTLYVIGTAQSQLDLASNLALNEVRNITFESHRMMAANIELATAGTLLLIEKNDVAAIKQTLTESNITELPVDVFEILRMEAGTPAYGSEVDETNLPQEFRRDEKAISFTKGCYLGQETVAKIDAMGHVNKFLVAVEFEGEQAPAIACELLVDDKKVGVLKSCVYSPKLNAWLGLGFVKCHFAKPGTMVVCDYQPGKIIVASDL